MGLLQITLRRTLCRTSTQDVYSDQQVDVAAIAACLNALAKWRRDALVELMERVALINSNSASDMDEAASDVAMSLNSPEPAELSSSPQDDVPEEQQWD